MNSKGWFILKSTRAGSSPKSENWLRLGSGLGSRKVMFSLFHLGVPEFAPQARAIGLNIKQGDFLYIFFYVLYSTLLHLPPLRFHCVGG
jgi:hypothetical protein